MPNINITLLRKKERNQQIARMQANKKPSEKACKLQEHVQTGGQKFSQNITGLLTTKKTKN